MQIVEESGSVQTVSLLVMMDAGLRLGSAVVVAETGISPADALPLTMLLPIVVSDAALLLHRNTLRCSASVANETRLVLSIAYTRMACSDASESFRHLNGTDLGSASMNTKS